jgi:hypothetical protein
MNIDLELKLRIRVTGDDKPIEKGCFVPILGRLLDKLAAHPCVLMILREFMGSRFRGSCRRTAEGPAEDRRRAKVPKD